MKKTTTRKLIANQQGQGVMEYVILSSLIGIFCLVAVKQFGEVVEKRIQNMRKHVVEHVQIK